MITNGIVALLATNDVIAQLVGDQIYPVVPPENMKTAYLLYQVITWPSWQTFRGPLNTSTMRVQVSAWAPRYADAAALGAAVRDALDGFSGVLPGAPDVLQVQRVTCDSYQDAYDSQAQLRGVQADYLWTFTRSTNN